MKAFIEYNAYPKTIKRVDGILLQQQSLLLKKTLLKKYGSTKTIYWNDSIKVPVKEGNTLTRQTAK